VEIDAVYFRKFEDPKSESAKMMYLISDICVETEGMGEDEVLQHILKIIRESPHQKIYDEQLDKMVREISLEKLI
jgi:hypothetical protein